MKHKQTFQLKSLPIWAVLFLLGFSAGYLYYEQNIPTAFSSDINSENFTVCFSPEGRCELLAVKAIASAQDEILVQAYSFTSKPIANALIEAQERGVTVRILFDKSQLKAPYSQIHRLTKEGIDTKVDYVSGIAHNKTIIVDGERLITGSYNFSKAANSRNAENMLYINDKQLAKIYKKKWHERFQKRRK